MTARRKRCALSQASLLFLPSQRCSAPLPLRPKVKGTVGTVNSQTRTLTIDGIAYLFPEEVGLVHLIPGDVVTLTYNATGTGNVVEKTSK